MTTTLLIWARAFHFGSGLILVSVVVFRWLILMPAFAGETEESWQEFAPLFIRLRALFLWSGLVLILSGVAWFWAVASGMSGLSLMDSLTEDTLGTVFFQTQFGSVCRGRIGLAVVLAVLMAWLARKGRMIRPSVSLLERGVGIIAIGLLVSIAGTGHAAAAGGADFAWRVLADATHLLAAAIWPTGLLPFALFLGGVRRSAELSNMCPTLAVVGRFSDVSFVTVGILIATGIVNACFIVGSFAALVDTDYGRLLCLKLFLLLIILGIAAWNRYRLVPLVFADAGSPEKKLAPALQRLKVFVTIEFALAVGIIFVVSILGITPPPR